MKFFFLLTYIKSNHRYILLIGSCYIFTYLFSSSSLCSSLLFFPFSRTSWTCGRQSNPTSSSAFHRSISMYRRTCLIMEWKEQWKNGTSDDTPSLVRRFKTVVTDFRVRTWMPSTKMHLLLEDGNSEKPETSKAYISTEYL